MAMAQARQVAGLLAGLVPGLDVAITGITTSTDQWSGNLAAIGGKGAFTSEIDRSLLVGAIDVAVHCIPVLRRHPVPRPFSGHLATCCP